MGRVLMPHHRCQAPGTLRHHEGHWSGNSPGYRPGAPLSREAGAGKCRVAVTPEMASDLLEAGHNRSWRVEVASQIYLGTASDIHSEVCMASRWVAASLEAPCSELEAWHTSLSAEVADNLRLVWAEAEQVVCSSHCSQFQEPEDRTHPRGCRTLHHP